MALNVGDKCPQCKEGLLERTELGLSCSNCSFDMEIEEVVQAQQEAATSTDEYRFKKVKFSFIVETPEQAEEFLRGCILAKQNNNSEYFPLIVENLNTVLEPWREARLKQELAARGS